MSKIKVLPPLLVNQIAAGECIERPASIVKELVENSIDAGATAIEVGVEEAGSRLIRITDNGCGIDREDLPLAITSHATSKLQNADDLLNIRTLGFRGEALASVASVADVFISSCPSGEQSGYKIRSFGGDVKPLEPVAMNHGTIIEVHDLFFNIPARRKFLKKKATEMGHITDTLTKLALSYHKASFKLTHNNKIVFHVEKTATLKERIEQLLAIGECEMLEISYERNGIEVQAFLAPPEVNRANSKQQYVYINGRCIKDRIVLRAVADAYSDYLPMKRHAVAVLFLQMHPEDVDVNVHPTKAEVRYRDSSGIYSAVYHATLEGLRKGDLRPSIPLFSDGPSTSYTTPSTSYTPPPANYYDSQSNQTHSNYYTPGNFVQETMANHMGGSVSTNSYEKIDEMDVPVFENAPMTSTTAMSSRTQPAPQSQNLFSEEEKNVPLRWFQVHDSYIIIETLRGIEVIDQHALHERIIYSKLKQQVAQKQVQSQMLLFPVTVHLTATEMATFSEWQQHLEELGMEMEVVRDDVIIRAIPQMVSDVHAGDLLRDLLEQLERKNKVNISDVIDPIIEMMSCKAAIKAGDNLNPEEVISLIQRREDADNPFHCPHGRPTTLKITLKELEKHFKRT
ncbi:DNA mismatch repair endonuclease MutL [Candidatus Uabimicrobium amorphum]|uniref:DNA mismatch repair protein MutL n=1 Tax=Uabimicrobium amorphum TaxID=2596890 RepID=A0A5S9F3M4_UABAM|nr:DNA mismatch repair endonuclease MutL [Candidatus Uabimicrobium amorphum]BBM83322.1 DNA mismatch repair protein MutL [Candidatus Uabimicrobium amorphum]